MKIRESVDMPAEFMLRNMWIRWWDSAHHMGGFRRTEFRDMHSNVEDVLGENLVTRKPCPAAGRRGMGLESQHRTFSPIPGGGSISISFGDDMDRREREWWSIAEAAQPGTRHHVLGASLSHMRRYCWSMDVAFRI